MVQLKPIGLYDELSFPDLEQMVAALKLTDRINMDQLYEEFCASREEIQKATKDTTKSTSEKWVAIFQNVGKANMILCLICPQRHTTNAFVERIFSLMTDE